MWFLFGAVIAGIIIYFVMQKKKQGNQNAKDASGRVSDETTTTLSVDEKPATTNDGISGPLDKLDATQDAATIWEMIRESNSVAFKREAYEKLSTSSDSYTCQLLGNNTFAYAGTGVKDYVLTQMAVTHVVQVEKEKVPFLELAKMVARQEKILDISTVLLLEKLLKEEKISNMALLKPRWLNNPKIWEQTDFDDRAFLINLKVFLDKEDLHSYVDENGQTLYEAVGNGLTAWETLINKYDRVKDLKAFLNCFSDD
jgi:hypothetical protein